MKGEHPGQRHVAQDLVGKLSDTAFFGAGDFNDPADGIGQRGKVALGLHPAKKRVESVVARCADGEGTGG